MNQKFSELILRRHPLYVERLPHWDFLEATYDGGRAWFSDNIFKYMKEGDEEFAARVSRAYRFNHTKQVVDLVDKYLFKMPVARNKEDAPEQVLQFWKSATLNGLDIDTFMRRVSNASSRYGRVWVVVDTTLTSSDIVTVADRKQAAGRPYCYIVRPQDMLDMAYDEAGQMQWALVRELARDDADPLNSTGDPIIRYRLWTREGWFLFEERTAVATGRARLNRLKVELLNADNHDLGIVPIVQADHNFSEEPYESSGLIDDIAYLDRANANYLSNLDAIIQDQTFSQLTMPAQGIMPGEDGHEALLTAGTKRVFTYNGEAGQRPEYISPDPRQASMILQAVGKIINEIYHSVGLAAERTKDDNGGGMDNASGVAKAYDFERVNSLLASKANTLQIIEDRIARIVALWEGVELPEGPLARYPEKFDTRSLYDEFEIGSLLGALAAPNEVRRKQMQMIIDKMFPADSEVERKKLSDALKSWPPEPPVEAAPGAEKPKDVAGGKTAPGTKKAVKELTT